MPIDLSAVLDQIDEKSKKFLTNTLVSGQAFYWIVSGLSRDFGYPSWDAVLEGVKDALGFSGEIKGNPLRSAELLHAYCRKSDLEHGIDRPGERFNRIVAETLELLRSDGQKADWIHKFIQVNPTTIVTTNWDDVLENIFDRVPNVVIRGDKCPQVSTNNINIFKIHGDFKRYDSIIVTQSQYNQFQREETYLNRKIYTLFAERVAIFMGYSLSDPNISFLYDEALAHVGPDKPPSFMVIQPNGADRPKIEAIKLLFSQKNVTIIEAKTGDFLDACLSLLKDAQAGIEAFKHEFEGVYNFLVEIVDAIKNKGLDHNAIATRFTSAMTADKALKAITRFFEMPSLYRELGGSLMSPSNHIDNNEASSLINVVISIGNAIHKNKEDVYTVNEKFFNAAINHCISNPQSWDFHFANRSFIDILRIRPKKGWPIGKIKAEHVKSILDWSAPRYAYGKCWATWDVFVKNSNYLLDYEVELLLDLVEHDARSIGVFDDTRRWLKKLLELHSDLPKEIRDRGEALLAH